MVWGQLLRVDLAVDPFTKAEEFEGEVNTGAFDAGSNAWQRSFSQSACAAASTAFAS